MEHCPRKNPAPLYCTPPVEGAQRALRRPQGAAAAALALAATLLGLLLLALSCPVSAQAATSMKLLVGSSYALPGAAAGSTYVSSAPATASVSARGVVTGRAAGTATVTARNAAGKATRVQVTVFEAAPEPAALAAPGTVRLLRASDASLKLSWSAVEGAAGYVIYAYEGGRYRVQRVVGSAVRTQVIGGLDAKTTYRYKVCAYQKAASTTVALGARSMLVSARPYAKGAKKVNANAISYQLAKLLVLEGRSVACGAQGGSTKDGASVLSKKVRYATSDPTIATVDAQGTITGVRKGTCYLVCRLHNGLTFKKRIFVRAALKDSYINFIAHRGAEYAAPENTLAAFQEAGKAGFAGFECDLWETKSGDIMVCHDSTLLSSCGVDVPVTKVTLANRVQYPITQGTNVGLYGPQYLPSVNQAASVASSYGMKLYLHIKQPDIGKKALKKIERVLERYGMVEDTVVFSTDITTVGNIRTHTGLRAGYLDRSPTNAGRLAALKRAVKAKASCVIFHYLSAEPPSLALVRRAHAAGLLTGVYGMSSKASATWMIDVGADFGISNKLRFTKSS